MAENVLQNPENVPDFSVKKKEYELCQDVLKPKSVRKIPFHKMPCRTNCEFANHALQNSEDVSKDQTESNQAVNLRTDLVPHHCKLFHNSGRHSTKMSTVLIQDNENNLSRDIKEEEKTPESHKTYMQLHKKNELNCRWCNEKFDSVTAFSSHAQQHIDVSHKCGICTASFSQLEILKDHFRIHTGRKLFECKKCSMAFHPKAEFINHSLTVHNNYGRHACSNCCRRFNRYEAYKKHLYSHVSDHTYAASITKIRPPG